LDREATRAQRGRGCRDGPESIPPCFSFPIDKRQAVFLFHCYSPSSRRKESTMGTSRS
jgi:hypothetical protein